MSEALLSTYPKQQGHQLFGGICLTALVPDDERELNREGRFTFQTHHLLDDNWRFGTVAVFGPTNAAIMMCESQQTRTIRIVSRSQAAPIKAVGNLNLADQGLDAFVRQIG